MRAQSQLTTRPLARHMDLLQANKIGSLTKEKINTHTKNNNNNNNNNKIKKENINSMR